MEHQTTERIASKAVPGVTYTLVRMVEGHRIELRKRTAATSRLLRPLMRELAELNLRTLALMPKAPDGEAPKAIDGETPKEGDGKAPKAFLVTPEMVAMEDRINELSEEVDFFEHTEMEPIWVQWGVVSIESVEPQLVDGVPLCRENVMFHDSGLYKEIVDTIRVRLGLNPVQTKNSSSLTTSTGSGGGTTGDSSVITAANPATDSTAGETAPAISQAT